MTRTWTEAELATLAEVAETFVRGDALRRANLAADALERAADPAQVDQIRLVLRVFESRVANALLTGRPSSFRSMSPAARERYLHSWATSRLALRRSAFQGLRKLLTFLAYADPGVDVPNARLMAIGYRPDDPERTERPTGIGPLRPAFETGPWDEPMVLEADAVVVGSGAGGGVIAAELARAGRSVVVLEAGPFVDERSMPADELDAFGRLYLNHGLLTTWDGSVTMLAGTSVGGGTLVNWMTCLPAPEWIREEWGRDHGLEGLTGAAWSEDVAALEAELDVSEAAVIPPKDQAILDGAAALGWAAAVNRRNATDCGDCGSCPFGCRRGSKRSVLRVHLAAAAAAGARIIPRVRVTRVDIAGGGRDRRRGQRPRTDASTGEPAADGRTRRLVVKAPIVALAAGALRTPAILTGSGLEHPAIGRNLRVHPAPVIAGLFPQVIDMWRGTMQAAHVSQFARGGERNEGYVIEAAPGHPGLLALALPWEGTDAHDDVMLASRRIGPFVAVTRDGGAGPDDPHEGGPGASRLSIGRERGRDAAACTRVDGPPGPRGRGSARSSPSGTPPAWHGRGGHRPGTGGGGLRPLRVDRLRTFDFAPNRGGAFSAHQMGTGPDGRAAGRPCLRSVGPGARAPTKRRTSWAASTWPTGPCSRRASGSTR